MSANGSRPDYKVFAGNSNRKLAEAIATALGRPLSDAMVGRFSDGEIQVEIGENIRGQDTYIIQSTCADANINLMELLIMIDALKRASAGTINAVIPYYGYARQDRKVASRSPITAKLVADLLEAAGATRVVSMDMHAGQIQGFFNIPFDHLYAAPVLLDHMRKRFEGKSDDLVIVSPDAGGVERARAYSKRLNASLAIIDKRRERANVSEVMNIIGDVSGRTCVIMDDIVDTANTLCKAATALKEHGAVKVVAYCTHPVLSGGAVPRIATSDIDELVVTDTIPLSPEAQGCPRIRQLSCAQLLAETMTRISNEESVSSLFTE
jgi:ribose-phosphate pyrophosphokinase